MSAITAPRYGPNGGDDGHAMARLDNLHPPPFRQNGGDHKRAWLSTQDLGHCADLELGPASAHQPVRRYTDNQTLTALSWTPYGRVIGGTVAVVNGAHGASR